MLDKIKCLLQLKPFPLKEKQYTVSDNHGRVMFDRYSPVELLDVKEFATLSIRDGKFVGIPKVTFSNPDGSLVIAEFDSVLASLNLSREEEKKLLDYIIDLHYYYHSRVERMMILVTLLNAISVLGSVVATF